MKTILIINDNSAEAKHAAEFVLAIAQKVQANILLGNIFINEFAPVKKVPAGVISENEIEELLTPDLPQHLRILNSTQSLFKPEIEEVDISNMNETEVAGLINKNNIWMMVKGVPPVLSERHAQNNLNVQTILNKVLCPLLLIPANWELKDLERLVYIADLRYCRIQIVRYLAEIARSWNADLSIAHLSAKGLPDMAEKYALSVFNDEVFRNVNYDRLLFNNIRERDLTTAVDVIINGMRNDLLVLVNHRFHFEEILGPYIPDNLPDFITIPLLIFPF